MPRKGEKNEEFVTPDVTDDAEAFYRLIATRIQLARKEARLSQADLARSIGLTPAAVANYENLVRRPSAFSLLAIAESLGRPLEWFWGYAASDGPPDLRAALRELVGRFGEAKYLNVLWVVDPQKPGVGRGQHPLELLPFPIRMAEGARFVVEFKPEGPSLPVYYLVNYTTIPREGDLVLAWREDDEDYLHIVPFSQVAPAQPIKERRRLVQAVIFAEFRRIADYNTRHPRGRGI